MSNSTFSASDPASVDAADVARFDQLAAQWWDDTGAMKPLHQFTPVRIKYIVNSIRRAGLSNSPSSPHPLSGLKMLDVGCGGGLLAEPLVRLGAEMTAIDASKGAIHAAQIHAKSQGLVIDYQNMSSEELLAQAGNVGRFDLVYASEVIEHVNDRHSFLSTLAQLVRPQGLVIITTINKSVPALLGAKFAAEYLLKIVPPGTHEFSKFISPHQLVAEAAEHDINIENITGFVPRLSGGFRCSSVTAINYGVCGRRR